MNQYTPLVLLPLKAKMVLLCVGVLAVIIGVTLGLAVLIDWIIGMTSPRWPPFP